MVFEGCHICDTLQTSQYYYHWNRHNLAVILIVKLWCLKNVTFVTPFNRHNITITRFVTTWRSFWYKFHVIWRMWQKCHSCHMIHFYYQSKSFWAWLYKVEIKCIHSCFESVFVRVISEWNPVIFFRLSRWRQPGFFMTRKTSFQFQQQ